MKLVLTLLVRDEEDIIGTNLVYHLSRGVDFVIATDNNSEDGTVDILREFARDGVLQLLHEPSDDYEQAAWVTRMARLAAVQHHADWVLNGDADEFWWPRSGDLKSSLRSMPDHAGVLVAHRTNFIPFEQSSDPFYESMVFRHVDSTNALGKPLLPKVGHRAAADVQVGQGNHHVSSPRLGTVLDDGRIQILHYPVRSYLQFENKILKGGAAYERNDRLPKTLGDSWRHLHDLHHRGRFHEYYRSLLLGEAELVAARRRGRVVRDERLRDFMRSVRERPHSRLTTAVEPPGTS